MNNQPKNRSWVNRWILLLIIGLLVESCILAGAAGLYLASRNAFQQPGPRPIWIVERNTSTTDPNSTENPQASETQPVKPTSKKPRLTATATVEPMDTSAVTPTLWAKPPKGLIVYVCFDGQFDQICTMEPDGSDRKKLTRGKSTNFYPSLSPDGSQVYFSSNRDGNFEIFRMDLNGENLTQITQGLGNAYAPAVSPAGNRIAFTLESAKQQNIWMMRNDGKNARPLTDGNSDVDPTWSPDGESLAFTSARSGVKQIFTTSASGDNPKPVLIPGAPAPGGRLSWSPDGQWLAFYGGPAGDRNLFITSLDGKNLRQLTNGGDNLAPSFSPDGNWLVFTSYRDGNNEIYVVKTDGSNAARLTNSSNADWQPRWGQ
jgi:TolB protein